MPARIKLAWEFLQEPRNWTTANVAVGMALILVVDRSNSTAEAFAIGWGLSAFAAALPSIFCSSWDFRSASHVKADRSLAYIEGWQHHQKSLEDYIGRAQGDNEISSKEVSDAAYGIFLEGLNRVESGKHLPNL